MVRPVMTYGSECWGLKKKDERKLNTTEMRMIRMMLGVTLKDKLRNEEVRRRTTVTTNVVTIVERIKLRWYGHLQRKDEEEVVRQVWEELIKKKRSRGQQLKRWTEKEIGGAEPQGTGCPGQAKMEKRDHGHQPLTR